MLIMESHYLISWYILVDIFCYRAVSVCNTAVLTETLVLFPFLNKKTAS